MYAAWLADFAARDIAAVGFGVITLRRPSSADGDRRIARLEEIAGPTAEAMGPVVADVLAAEQWLLGRTDGEVAMERFVVADDVTEERFGRPGAADPEVIRLSQGGGLRRSVRVDTALAAVVGACDGELPLGALVQAVAELLDEDLDPLAGRVLPAVRRLVADGLLRLA